MPKIIILMSTYNGNAYIEDQIRSIYEQSFRDFQLVIRDDGSEPAFRKKLEELKKQYGFRLIEGKNAGFSRSFMALLRASGDADLYAFADQDDIWLPDKLERAADFFNHRDKISVAGQSSDITGTALSVDAASDTAHFWDAAKNTFISADDSKNTAPECIPILYHSAYDIVDSDTLKKTGHFYFPEKGYDFRRSITENHYSGFSMVINRPLRELMLRGRAEKLVYHDWWAGMIAHAMGAAFSDPAVTSLHRAHGDNVTTFSMKTRFQWLKKSLTEDTDIKKRAQEFLRCFAYDISRKDQKTLLLFAGKRYSPVKALKKAFYPKRWRPVLSSELISRFLMLIGRM